MGPNKKLCPVRCPWYMRPYAIFLQKKQRCKKYHVFFSYDSHHFTTPQTDFVTFWPLDDRPSVVKETFFLTLLGLKHKVKHCLPLDHAPSRAKAVETGSCRFSANHQGLPFTSALDSRLNSLAQSSLMHFPKPELPETIITNDPGCDCTGGWMMLLLHERHH